MEAHDWLDMQMGVGLYSIPTPNESVVDGGLTCPDCGGIVKDQIYSSGYAIHGNFYCVTNKCFKPVQFNGHKEYREKGSSFRNQNLTR